MNDVLGANKLYDALKNNVDKYNYIWLSGDTTVIKIDNLYEEVQYAMSEKVDFIHIYRNSNNIHSGKIQDCVYLFKYFYWSFTHCCSYILSDKMVENVLKYVEVYNRNIRLSFMFNDAIFDYIAKNKFVSYYICNNLYETSPYRTCSTVHYQKKILKVWGEDWCKEIDDLPLIYLKEKKFVKKSLSENIGLFSWYGIIKLRAEENLDFNKFIKYNDYLKQITDVPLIHVWFCSIIPINITKAIVILIETIKKKLVYFKHRYIHGVNNESNRLYSRMSNQK